MTDSMTAFARGQIQLESAIFCWEIRSVNHRFLDTSLRLPENWRFLETDLRAAIRHKISRGKLECQLKQQDASVNEQSVIINETLVDTLLKSANQLAEKKGLANDLSLSQVLNWPGVVQMSAGNIEHLAQPLLNLFNDTLQQLQEARRSEGDALAEQIELRISRLNDEIVTSRRLATEDIANYRDKLQTRLNALQAEVDPARLEQEIALLLTKLDVSEELDRLVMHTKEVSKALKSREPAGRRLDFLMQELNREANTLSSKSDSVQLTQSAVEMKVLIEQMREQIQNIE